MSVSEIQKELEIPMSNLSNHISSLFKIGVLSRETRGTFHHYYLTETRLLLSIATMKSIINSILGKRKTSFDKI